MLQSNKDRQEAAIYTFTIVTVVFLPLTFVTGVLGMNTNDIRNMKKNQWVYWISAVPLTVIVIAMSLYIAGELSFFFPNPFHSRRRGPDRDVTIKKSSKVKHVGVKKKYGRVLECHGIV
jgi:hypothetical protein